MSEMRTPDGVPVPENLRALLDKAEANMGAISFQGVEVAVLIKRIATLQSQYAHAEELLRDSLNREQASGDVIERMHAEIKTLRQDRDSYKFCIGQFMGAMAGDTKGIPPWEKVAKWRTENVALRERLEAAAAPLSDKEFYSDYENSVGVRDMGLTREQINKLLAARAFRAAAARDY